MRAELLIAYLLAVPAAAQSITSTVNTISITDGAQPRAVATVSGIVESPNFAPDMRSILINQNGRFLRIALQGSAPPEPFSTGEASGCWGEHGFSPDGRSYAVSCKAPGEHGPDVHIVAAAGGAARRITHQPISFFHGWSPDGATIVFTSILDGLTDIYTVPVAGGPAQRLTTTGLNDGGEFSADGKLITFNSNRGGSMQIWRMRTDGSNPEQVTDDAYDNWYPHISPDGKWMVLLSYAKGEASDSHPMNKNVVLRLRSLRDGTTREIAHFVGGQGTLDSPCWSPDSQQIGFVSYDVRP
jgi:Tol biopolymer transport system component